MKKIFSIIAIVFFLTGTRALAATSYSRNPAGSGPYPSVDLTFSFTDSSDFSCSTLNFTGWYLRISGDNEIDLNGTMYGPTDLSETDTITLPPGYTANEVDVVGACTGGDTFLALEGYSATPLFIGPQAVSGGHWITASTTAATKTLAVVSGSLSDAGTLKVLALAAGIPLAFYVIDRLASLFPGRNREIAAAEEAIKETDRLLKK